MSNTLPTDRRHLVGGPRQLARVLRCELTEGQAAGAPTLVVHNPGGISFDVALDKALDIDWADALGIPLASSSTSGRVDARRYDAVGRGWGSIFGGGLLATCGLASTGAPTEVDGVAYGQHGRISHTAAEQVTWQVEPGEVRITGTAVEGTPGEPALRLSRTISASTKEARLSIVDMVSNEGFAPAGHMFRHHLNFGYPLVSENSRLTTEVIPIGTRDGARPGPLSADQFLFRVADRPVDEMVWYADSGDGRAELVSPDAGVRLKLDWSIDTFPRFIVWRNASPGVNVLGLEPSTSRDGGRDETAESGELIMLQPGEARTYVTEITVERL